MLKSLSIIILDNFIGAAKPCDLEKPKAPEVKPLEVINFKTQLIITHV